MSELLSLFSLVASFGGGEGRRGSFLCHLPGILLKQVADRLLSQHGTVFFMLPVPGFCAP